MNQILPLEIIYKDDVSSNIWSKAIRAVKGMAAATCDGIVTPTYIRDTALKAATVIMKGFVTSDREARGGKLKAPQLAGFLVANESEYPGFLYIDVVCSNKPNIGRRLIEAAEDYAKRRKMKGVTLSSLPHVVGYYRSLGYKNTLGCSIEKKEIVTEYEKKALPLITKYKKDVVYKINTQEGEQYREFLKTLIANKMAKNKKCKTVDSCNHDGYVMSKCFIPL